MPFGPEHEGQTVASDDESEPRPRRLGPYLELVLRPFPEAVLKELDQERTTLAIDLYEHALAAFPDNIDALKALGNAYTEAKRFMDGLRIDKRLVALLPNDPVVRYNLACSWALLGVKDQAFEALERAIALGYDEFEYLVEDDDLAGLRDDPRFDALLHG